ncbi:unnamed protein product, partial [marine sediment metagenome]
LYAPNNLYKTVGQASRLSRIDSRFRGNDKEERRDKHVFQKKKAER